MNTSVVKICFLFFPIWLWSACDLTKQTVDVLDAGVDVNEDLHQPDIFALDTLSDDVLLPDDTLSPDIGVSPWANSGGGIVDDQGNDITVDINGNVYVTGFFGQYVGGPSWAIFGSTTLWSKGWTDTFVAKYDNKGTLLWSKSAGGLVDDQSNSIAVDLSGNVYVTGYFNGSGQGDPTAEFGNTTLTSKGWHDVFVAKYDNNGALLWAKSAGGASGDAGEGIAVDTSGNVYVTGSFNDTAIFETTTLTSKGWPDIFVAKYNSAGTLLWIEAVGGSDSDFGYDIAVDASGSAYVTGIFNGEAVFGSETFSAVINDIFVAKYNTNGTLLWAKSAGKGQSSDDGSYGIAVDKSANVYVTGNFEYQATFDSVILSGRGECDLFVAKYNTNGTLLWAKSAGSGGPNHAVGESIAVDKNQNAYVAGRFEGIVEVGRTTLLSNGLWDVFVAKYDALGQEVWAEAAGGGYIDHGMGVAVDESGDVYVTGGFFGQGNFGTNHLSSVGQSDVFIWGLGVY